MKVGQKVTPTGVLVAPASLPETEWLALRKAGVGGSDVGAILGLSKYGSPWGVYLEKRGEAPPLPRSERLERAAMWGHLHEQHLAEVFCQETGFRVRRIGLIRHMDEPWRMSNLDRQVIGCPDGPCFLEEKSRSQYVAGEWGESGDPDGVPDTEALQTYWYMGVNGYTHGHVAVLIGGNDDRYYRLNRDETLIADVNAVAADFWRRVREGDPPPVDGSEADSELLEHRWNATDGSAVDLDADEFEALRARVRQMEEAAQAAETAIAEAKNQIRAMLGDAETGLVGGKPAVTWKRNGTFAAKRFAGEQPEAAGKYERLVPGLDMEALKAAEPDLYRAYRSRALRIKGGTSR